MLVYEELTGDSEQRLKYTSRLVPDCLNRSGRSVSYKGVELSCGYHLDVVVQDTVVLELKAVERRLPIHEAQLLTYLRLSRKRVGLLINFNVATPKKGIVRRVL
jgi:GxxExxY protein